MKATALVIPFVCVCYGSVTTAQTSPPAATAAPLGVSYQGWKGGFKDPAARLRAFADVGFAIVSFVPTFSYDGLNRVDLASGPDATELGAAVEAALRAGFQVVIKPHLDSSLYRPNFDPLLSENHSWRVQCGWRGFFDLDPMTPDYRDGVVLAYLRMLKSVLERIEAPAGPRAAPVRLELGAELMNSVVYNPAQWDALLARARRERQRLGLEKQVLLSHNFSHHLEIHEDVVGRMDRPRKQALARYLKGLDAVAVSQYMDLTAAMPPDARGGRLPTADEVADALVLHETNLRRDIFGSALGLRPHQIPPFHIGEFGVGFGGLRHPNLWSGQTSPKREEDLALEITRAHEGLLRYLSRPQGRTARSAVLWVTGPHFDIFGWDSPRYAIPEAAAVVKAGCAATTKVPR